MTKNPCDASDDAKHGFYCLLFVFGWLDYACDFVSALNF